jgi:hypothetical protein
MNEDYGKLSNAKVKFGQRMHENIKYLSDESGLEKSKIIRASMICGINYLLELFNVQGKDAMIALVINLDKSARK